MNTQHERAGLALALALALASASSLALSTAAWAGDDKSEDPSLRALSAQWWQWALSIPAPVNPLAEGTAQGVDVGSRCMVGQRGSVWFLAGTLVGGTVSRKCSVPAGVTLFFPVVNSVQVNTPGICYQDAALTVPEMRANVAPFIDGVTKLTVTLDGTAVKAMRRVRSEPFAAALPADNLFVPYCGPGGQPAGVYSPGVDDGYYVRLEGLKPGPHTLQFTALNPSAGFDLNMTYQLDVVPVSKR